MRSNPDDSYAKVLLENHKRSQKNQNIQRTSLIERVNAGKGTPEEIAKIKHKREKDILYNRTRRKHEKGTAAKRAKKEEGNS